jgi:hypothetical protein
VVGGLEMKKNKKLVTGALMIMTAVLLATTIYISSLLSSPDKSPTQVQKTKAAQQTYTKQINLADNFGSDDITPEIVPTIPTIQPTRVPVPISTTIPKILAKDPTATPVILAQTPTDIPESINQPTTPMTPATSTTPPLLAYKSTTVSPTLIPIKNAGGVVSPTMVTTKAPSPIKKIVPTGVETLPETGWIQFSSIFFIVATTTILFSLLF